MVRHVGRLIHGLALRNWRREERRVVAASSENVIGTGTCRVSKCEDLADEFFGSGRSSSGVGPIGQ